MKGNVMAVVVALLCVLSLVLAAPLLQPDLGGVTDSSVGEQDSDAIAEGVGGGFGSGDEPADEPGEEDGSEGGEGESGSPPVDDPLAGDEYDDEDRERLGDDANPIDEETTGGIDGEVGELRYGAVQTFYWRTGSYDRYTGDGWERTGEPNAYTPPHDFDGPAERHRFDITTETAMSIVPAPYQPVAADISGADIVARDDGAFELTDRATADTSMTITSDVPEWRYEELKAASGNYDSAIIERYGTPRSETPERVTERTNRITANQSTPYGTAVAIEYWLKNERGYSLEVPQPEGDVVDEFLYEMEAGYCEYFASAMTEMLRTQGIPARYVTGYSRAPVDENGVEEVSSDRAHAWVEVYFEGVGWVIFDPTPPERDEVRLDTTERTAVSDAYEPQINYAQHDIDENWEVVDADVELLSEPIPDTDGTVRVTDAGAPLTDHRVSYNGDVVGLTDKNGEVTGTLPYASSLNVTVERYTEPGEPDEEEIEDETDEEEIEDETDEEEGPPDEEEAPSDGERSNTIGHTDPFDERPVGGSISLRDELFFTVYHDSTDPQSTLTADTDSTDRVFASGASLGGFTTASSTANAGGIPLDTNIDITLDEDEPLHPGSTVTLTATIRENPVRDATVTVGEETYTTDENGTANIDVPYVATASIEVTREVATGTHDAPVTTDVSVAFADDPVPGSEATIEATIDGRPVDGLQVLIDDAVIARTDANGTATVPIRYTESVQIVASQDAVFGATTTELPTEIDTDIGWFILPGGSATITATVEGVPVSNATVTAQRTADTETDSNGTASLPVPVRPQPTLAYTVERGAAAGEGSLALLRSWLAIALATFGLGGVVARRVNLRASGRQVAGGVTRLTASVVALPRQIVTGIVRLAVWGKDIFARGGRSVFGSLRLLGVGLLSTVRRAMSAVPRILTRVAVAITAIGARVFDWLRWLCVGPRTWIERLRSDAVHVDDDPEATTHTTPSASGDDVGSTARQVSPRVIVLRAWRWLLRVVSPRSTMTPAEIADQATALGLPDRYVQRILDAFRSLRYGHNSPSPEDAEAVAEAEQSLRSTREGDE